MSDDARGEADGPAPVEESTVSELAHELVNVVSAMRVHVFMARRLIAAGAPDGAPASTPGSPGSADSSGSADSASTEESERWTIDESLQRLESMVDRAVELATGLDQEARELQDKW